MDHEVLSTPSVSKACSRCRSRKVKCDLTVPRCSACVKQNEDCNIIDCVSYPYSEIKKLQDKIEQLQARLEEDRPRAERQAVNEQDGPAGRSSQAAAYPFNQAVDDVRKAAEEVGVLAVTGCNQHSGNAYAGSATGSTFVRIFFKQLHFTPPSNTHPRGIGLEQCPSVMTASLPTPFVAKWLLNTYIARVHVWWPFLSLPHLRRILEHIYQDPAQCNEFEKFLIFIVLALASNESTEKEDYRQMRDLNTPMGYFQASLRFFGNFSSRGRELPSLQALILLGIWMLSSTLSSHHDDLWQLSRYAMSIAIETGLHRHNADWAFTADELEIRNRTWWAIYALERQVAVLTGRVLSVRDHAVQALMPSAHSLDQLNSSEASVSPIFHTCKVWPFGHLVRLRRISGRVLESVYIARGRDGQCPTHSFQEICAMTDEIHRDLEEWKRQLDTSGLKPSREYSELKIEFCIVLLLLNRPSPTFMVPSREMLAVCSRASSSAIRQWKKIVADYGISAVCRCSRQLHAILLVGLAAIYCDWQSITMASIGTSADPLRILRHEQDTATVIELLERGVKFINDSCLERYTHLFHATRCKVYAQYSNQNAMSLTSEDNPLFPHAGGSQGTLENLGVDGMQPFMFSQADGLEAYRSQITGFLDAGVLDVDNMFTAWYSSIMDETQPSRFAFAG